MEIADALDEIRSMNARKSKIDPDLLIKQFNDKYAFNEDDDDEFLDLDDDEKELLDLMDDMVIKKIDDDQENTTMNAPKTTIKPLQLQPKRVQNRYFSFYTWQNELISEKKDCE